MRAPFELHPDPELYVAREATERAIHALAHALLTETRLVLLAGPPGIGKSVVLARALRQLVRHGPAIVIDQPDLAPDDVALWAMRELESRGAPGATTATSWVRRRMRQAFSEESAACLALVERARAIQAPGRRVFVLIDCADDVELDVLRTLSRLVGLASGALSIGAAAARDEALTDPEIAVVELTEPMTLAETEAYIDARLARTSAPPALRAQLDAATIRRLHSYTQGNPRRLHAELSLQQLEQLPPSTTRQAAPDDRGTAPLGDGARAAGPPAEGGRAASDRQADSPAPAWRPRPATREAHEPDAPTAAPSAPAKPSAQARTKPTEARAVMPSPAHPARRTYGAAPRSASTGHDMSASTTAGGVSPVPDRARLSPGIAPRTERPSITAAPRSELTRRPEAPARRRSPPAALPMRPASTASLTATAPPRAVEGPSSVTPTPPAPAAGGPAGEVRSNPALQSPVLQASVGKHPAAWSGRSPLSPAARSGARQASGEAAPERDAEGGPPIVRTVLLIVAVIAAVTVAGSFLGRSLPSSRSVLVSDVGADAPPMLSAEASAKASDDGAREAAMAAEDPGAAVATTAKASGARSIDVAAPPRGVTLTPAEAGGAATRLIPVNINAEPYAIVSVDGRELGLTPLGRVPLPEGFHTFEARLPDGRTLVQSVDIRDDQRWVYFDGHAR
jgi:type II secretory pathway predicted ATPase ExeA